MATTRSTRSSRSTTPAVPIRNRATSPTSVRKSKRIQARPKYATGTNILKKFTDPGFEGWYVGEVRDSWYSEEARVWVYIVNYDDGDQESIDEPHMPKLVQDYIQPPRGVFLEQKRKPHPPKKEPSAAPTRKKFKREARRDLSYSPPRSYNPPPRRNLSYAAPPRTTRARSPPTRAPPSRTPPTRTNPPRKTPSKKTASSSGNSSLWSLVDTPDQPIRTRDDIPNLILDNARSSSLPQSLRSCLPELVEFSLFMYERQRIQQGHATQIEVLQTHHWCNNYRELDRGTAYFRSQVLDLRDALEKQGKLTRHEFVLEVLAMSVYYRQCNKIQSFLRSPRGRIPRLGEFNDEFVAYVESYFDPTHNPHPESFFTSAHLVQGCTRYVQYCKDTPSIKRVAHKIASMPGYDLKQVCQALTELKGVNDFMSWQICCDLEEACCLGPKLEEAKAFSGIVGVFYNDDYCRLGPGAILGLEAVFGQETLRDFEDDKLELAKYVRDNLDYCLGLANKSFPSWRNQRVGLKVIEHALCEFQKFKRLDQKGGAGRRYQSRSFLDPRACELKSSRRRDQPHEGELIRCDTCHLSVCEECSKMCFHHVGRDENERIWNCCTRCYSLDKLILEDR